MTKHQGIVTINSFLFGCCFLLFSTLFMCDWCLVAQCDFTLQAESPSIFLEKSGRRRRKLCSWPAFSLIRRSSKNMDKSVQFRTRCTGLPLMRMLNRRNCWLFSCPRHIVYNQSTKSRSFFNFLCGNDTFVSLPTGHGKSLIYQVCPAAARKLASTGKKLPSEPMVIVVSPLIFLIADQISSSVKWSWPAYTTPMVRGICTFTVYFSVSRRFLSLHSCLWRALRIRASRTCCKANNFKRS